MANKILYITTTFPALSMTFVDREIKALTEAGYNIEVVSRGTPKTSDLSPETLPFYERTLCLDQVSIFRKVFAQLRVLTLKPQKWFYLARLILLEREYKCFYDVPRSFYHFLEAGYLYTRLKNEGISHIHAHILNAPTSIALFLSRYLGIPFSFTMHGSNIHFDPLMLKTKLILCKKAVTVSEFNRRFLLKKYGEEFSNKIEVIRCGIDVKVFKPQKKKKTIPTLILAVGRLIEVKGFRFLIEACSILKKKGLAFQCQIVGDGEQMDALTGMAKSLGVTDLVTFLGRQPQQRVRELLQEASIFALPSIICDDGTREGLPVSLMEAMAMELPVVSTNTVGIPELVTNKSEGLLVAHSNGAEIALALEFLLTNPNIATQMGRIGRTKVIREFNIADVPAKFDPIFN